MQTLALEEKRGGAPLGPTKCMIFQLRKKGAHLLCGVTYSALFFILGLLKEHILDDLVIFSQGDCGGLVVCPRG
jgi:hypothetical protein